MILGIHLADSPCAIALRAENKVLAQTSFPSTYERSENLMVPIQALCDEVKRPLQDIRALGVTQGPGGYTSIRLAVTAAKSIAQVLGIPVFGFSTLEAMALPFRNCGKMGITVTPGIKGEVNAALWGFNQGVLNRLTPDFRWTFSQLRRQLTLFKHPVMLIANWPANPTGEAADVFSILESSDTIEVVRTCTRGDSVALLAQEALDAGGTGDAENVVPQYSSSLTAPTGGFQ